LEILHQASAKFFFEVVELSTLQGQLEPGGLAEISGLFSYLWNMFASIRTIDKQNFMMKARLVLPETAGGGLFMPAEKLKVL